MNKSFEADLRAVLDKYNLSDCLFIGCFKDKPDEKFIRFKKMILPGEDKKASAFYFDLADYWDELCGIPKID